MVAWCFIPVRWTTLTLNLDKQSRHCSSWPELFYRLKVFSGESWSTQIVSRLSSRYECRSRTTQTVARHILRAVWYWLLASLRERDQFFVGFMVSSCCFWSRTHGTCTPQASMSRVKCQFELGRYSTGGCTSAVLSASNANRSVLSNGGNLTGCSFRSRVLSGAAVLAYFVTNRLNTLHSLTRNLRSARKVDAWSSPVASVVCDKIFERLRVSGKSNISWVWGWELRC